ncbi:MAG: YhbY family RNA-binding protein [bacterium]|jgi:RNA-binding protein
MLTSKQRAALRSLANRAKVTIHVGKNGINSTLVQQVDVALTARELVKGTVLQNSALAAKEAVAELAAKTGSEVVQVMGRKFVLFRPNPDEPFNPENT